MSAIRPNLNIFSSLTDGISTYTIWFVQFKRGWWSVIHRRIVGWPVVFYGVYLATLTGSYTSLVLPGAGSIAIGAGTGATVGFMTWLAVVTVGVVTGGTGVEIGAGAMALLFGGAGGGGVRAVQQMALTSKLFHTLLYPRYFGFR